MTARSSCQSNCWIQGCRQKLQWEVGGRSMTISLSRKEASTITAENPKAYEEIWRNGNAFKGLRVDLSAISIDRVPDLLERSWRYSKRNRSAIRSLSGDRNTRRMHMRCNHCPQRTL